MNRLWPLVANLMLIFSWLASAPSAVHGQNTDVVLRFVPSILQVAVGETVDVAVAVENATGLYGFDIAVGFDPAVVEVVDFDPNLEGIQVALGLFLDPGFVIFNQASNELGQLRLVMTQLNPSEAKSGTGNLLVIRFRALQAGQTPLLLAAGELAQRDGTTFFPELVNGQITAVTSAPPQPTHTPIPTQLAGTPMPEATPALFAASATPRVTQTATAVLPTATPPPPTATPQATAPAPTNTSQPALPTSAATTPASAAQPTAVKQMATAIPEAVAAQSGGAAAPAEVQDGQESAASAAIELAMAGNGVAETAVPETSLTVIGSGMNLTGESTAAASTNPVENSGQNAGIQVFLFISGLLLVIGAFFFFMSRKRQPGD